MSDRQTTIRLVVGLIVNLGIVREVFDLLERRLSLEKVA